MKEATGELNATVVVIIAIAGLSAFFFTTIWPMIRKGTEYSAKCSDAVCSKPVGGSGVVSCTYTPYTIDLNSSEKIIYGTPETIECPYKG